MEYLKDVMSSKNMKFIIKPPSHRSIIPCITMIIWRFIIIKREHANISLTAGFTR